MVAYRRVYDSRHVQADCQEPGSVPEPYARQSSMGYLYLYVCLMLAMRHRQLLTVFALSVRYSAPDVSLVVSCGILPCLMHLRDTALVTHHSAQARLNDISCVLATASMHLLQILAITSR